MSTSEARARLAQQQAELVRSLTTTEDLLPGFDAGKVAAAAQSLRNKRFRSAKRSWPVLFGALGEFAEKWFSEFAANVPLPSEGGPLADGREFVDFLARTKRLPDAGRLHALLVDLHNARTPNGLSPRRGLVVKAALLRNPMRFFFGFRSPVIGVRLFSLPLGGISTNTSRRRKPPAPRAD
jgi:hypothetical protein